MNTYNLPYEVLTQTVNVYAQENLSVKRKAVSVLRLIQNVQKSVPVHCIVQISKYIYIKQDQGSKAPSRDHPNNSFMTRLDYFRVED